MARRKVEVRREEILAAAEAEVTRRGFARTRVADVAAALDCSSALIFYHFGTKEKLFAEALHHASARDLARLDDVVAKASDPVDGVRRILALYSPQGDANGWTLWVDAWSEALLAPSMCAGRTFSPTRSVEATTRDCSRAPIPMRLPGGCRRSSTVWPCR